MQIFFETHGETHHSRRNIASGWSDPSLTRNGRKQAERIGRRHDYPDTDAVFVPDLQRGIQTATRAFVGITPRTLFIDHRLRECDYGAMTGWAKDKVEAEKPNRIHSAFPAGESPLGGFYQGESYDHAVDRIGSFIDDLSKSSFNRVVIIGGHAVHYGLDFHIRGIPIEEKIQSGYEWMPGWEFEI
jgi:broad specificity phosphatase PhoE